jgi:hypothetical protein
LGLTVVRLRVEPEAFEVCSFQVAPSSMDVPSVT